MSLEEFRNHDWAQAGSQKFMLEITLVEAAQQTPPEAGLLEANHPWSILIPGVAIPTFTPQTLRVNKKSDGVHEGYPRGKARSPREE